MVTGGGTAPATAAAMSAAVGGAGGTGGAPKDVVAICSQLRKVISTVGLKYSLAISTTISILVCDFATA